MNSTNNGEFTVDILSDSSNQPVNTPLLDNPRQNVVRGRFKVNINSR